MKISFYDINIYDQTGEKYGFSHHNSLSLCRITESVNFFPTNTGFVKSLLKEEEKKISKCFREAKSFLKI
jgi:hypothetical protein